MNWSEAAPWWLPTAVAAALIVLGMIMTAALPGHPRGKSRIATVLLLGVLAIGVIAWQQNTSRNALGDIARLRARLDEVARLLPAGPGATQAETFDSIAAALNALNARIAELESQTRALEEKSRTRTIDPDTAEKIAEWLRGSGGHRVVVSCVPDDVEAYTYANQIANVLRAAGWEALGPQTTTIFGDAPAMGVTLYVRGGGAPTEAARLVLAAFARFNIPYQSGITPSPAIPDPATVELFVGHKP